MLFCMTQVRGGGQNERTLARLSLSAECDVINGTGERTVARSPSSAEGNEAEPPRDTEFDEGDVALFPFVGGDVAESPRFESGDVDSLCLIGDVDGG